MKTLPFLVPSVLMLLATGVACASTTEINDAVLDQATVAVKEHVISWRRDIHEHPELGNREFRTGALVAKHLQKLGFEVHTGVAHTGVVGILRGDLPGGVIALRADMDALPVTEMNQLPFKSTVTTEYAGSTVGVMHACGHDTHVAMLMGVAEALAGLRKQLPGTVILIFQPAEEGAPEGETGGAELMLSEGVFGRLKPDVIFGMHMVSSLHTGEVAYRAGPFMAAADSFNINVTGVQTHGAKPWQGVDPIVTSAQIVMGLQSIISRQTDVSKAPAVLTVGSIQGGNRSNIVPGTVDMKGTLRTFDPATRDDLVFRMQRTVANIAEANGATAKISLTSPSYPATVNNLQLTDKVVPSLQRAVGARNLTEPPLETASEDFAFFAQAVPGAYFLIGGTPPDQDATTAAVNHSPFFYVDENALQVGVKTMLYVAVDYLQKSRK